VLQSSSSLANKKHNNMQFQAGLVAFCVLLLAAADAFLTHAPLASCLSRSSMLRMSSNSNFDVTLTKPMGIVFEENDEKFGGIYVKEIKSASVAAASGSLKAGDQLVAVDGTSVKGASFDRCMQRDITVVH
jgi:C-terminal processing protease CtpA/Prc